MATVTQIGPRLGIAPTCAALGLPRATLLSSAPAPASRATAAARRRGRSSRGRARGGARACCMSRASWTWRRRRSTPRCSTKGSTSAPSARCIASWPRTRRCASGANQLRHPRYAAPELLARRPNELWSWDITKLLGPAKWTYFYLYVMLDVFSRYVVGWMVAHRESATLAEQFIRETCARQGIGREQLTIHADRGPAMTSKPVALLLADLGVTKTHRRPHVSNDNPFSEAQFKTLKYRPAFPERFGSIQDARAHCHDFFPWYNTEHHHSGLGLLTPHDVHYGLAEQRVAERAAVLATAYAAHPERFPAGPPVPAAVPTEVWINPPTPRALEEVALTH